MLNVFWRSRSSDGRPLADRLIREENIGVAGGYASLCLCLMKELTVLFSVPSMVSDLTESSLPGYPLDALLFGGAPAPDQLAAQARRAFPSAIMLVRSRLCGTQMLRNINLRLLGAKDTV